MEGWVYFIQCNQGPIKIGWTATPTVRLEAIQTCCPYEIVLLGKIRAPKIAERRLHRRFLEHHIRGEWFEPDQSLLDLIASIKRADYRLPNWLVKAPNSEEQRYFKHSEELAALVRQCAAPARMDDTPKRQITRVAKLLGISYGQTRRAWYGLSGPRIYPKIMERYHALFNSELEAQ